MSNYKDLAGPGFREPPDHAIGRSRGGLTSKIHLIADGRGCPLSLILTPGNINDTTMLGKVIGGIRVARPGPGRPRTRPEVVLADWQTRATRREPTAPTSPAAASRPTSPTATTRSPDASAEDNAAVARPASTPTSTGSATSSSVPSTDSRTGAGSPPVPTRRPATTAPGSCSHRS